MSVRKALRLWCGLLGLALAPAAGRGQGPCPAGACPPPAAVAGLPPAPAPAACPPLVGPYFEPDPLLDPADGPPLGPFAGVELGLVVPHVKNGLNGPVLLPGADMPDTVALPSAPLDWTAMPRFEAGWRLPAGFGQFQVGYRFLGTDGRGVLVAADGTLAALRSRFDLNVVDLDYASQEFSLLPCCDMRWAVGARIASLFFDSQAADAFASARVSNHYLGAGPHVGVDLARPLGDSGLALFCRGDAAALLGRVRQGFSEGVIGPDGQPLQGETRLSGSQAAAMIDLQAGMTWRPPAWPHVTVFLGYEYEYWWNVGRLFPSTGEVSVQGVAVRATFDF
jgi:hypothetical protein